MTFLAILFTILLIFWVLKPLFPRLFFWAVQRQMRKQMRDAFGADPFKDMRDERQSRQRPNPEPRRQRTRRNGKIFTKDVGEYVEFEEISEFKGSQNHQSAQRTNIKPEPQIVDAEWEDIK